MNWLLLLATNVADSSFIRLFTEMSPWAIVFFVLGIIFCAIELAMPGFGFFGIAGGVLLVVGIVIRMIGGGDALMLVYMIIILGVLLIGMFLLFGRLISKGKLSKTSIFNVRSSVSEQHTEGTKDFGHLVGATGTTQTPLRPIGRAVFDGEVVDVVARDGYVDSGATVTVIGVEGQTVTVIAKD